MLYWLSFYDVLQHRANKNTCVNYVFLSEVDIWLSDFISHVIFMCNCKAREVCLTFSVAIPLWLYCRCKHAMPIYFGVFAHILSHKIAIINLY